MPEIGLIVARVGLRRRADDRAEVGARVAAGDLLGERALEGVLDVLRS